MTHEPDDEVDDEVIVDEQFTAILDGVLVVVHGRLAEHEARPDITRPARARVGDLAALVGAVGSLVAESARDELDLTVRVGQGGEPAWLSFREALIDLAVCALEAAIALSIPRAPGTDERVAAREGLLPIAYWEVKEWVTIGPSPTARPLEWLASLIQTTAALADRVVEIDAAARAELYAVESIRQQALDRPDAEVDPLSWVVGQAGVASTSLAALAIYAATAISSDPTG